MTPTARALMSRCLRSALWGALALLSASPGLVAAAPPAREPGPRGATAATAPAPAEEGRVIVKYREGAVALRATAAAAGTAGGENGVPPGGLSGAQVMGSRLGLALSNGRTVAPRTQVLRATALDSQALAARLKADADVEWVVADRLRHVQAAPNDPYYADGQTTLTPAAGQWYLRAPTAERRAAIDIETAWAVTRGRSDVVVAVLDTGVRTGHPDLAGQLLAGHDFVTDLVVANDGNGRDSDPGDPGDWITASESLRGSLAGCTEADSSWHGTQVAGLVAAATDNGIGIAGTAPLVKVLPVRVLGKCGGYDSDIIAGMRWAAGLAVSGVATNTAHKAQVLNLSLGGSDSCSSAYQEAVDEILAAGTAIVASAGNEGEAVGSPANCSGAIAVAGVRHAGTKVGYSNLGPQVAVAAPAGNCVLLDGSACLYPIVSTTNAGTTVPETHTYTDGLARYAVGTSFSSPIVAGTAALMIAANPALTPAELRRLLRSTARAFPTTGADADVGTCQAPGGQVQDSECYCTTSTCGAGLLDAGAAVRAAAAAAGPVAGFSVSASSVTLGNTVSLDSAAATASTGASLVSRAWTLTDGSSRARFSSSTDGVTAVLQTVAPGTVTVQLQVTDSLGRSATAQQSLVITAAAPTARFSLSDTTPTVGDTVALNGSDSTVASGLTLASYSWALTAGGSLAHFSGDTDTATAQLVADAAGTVTVSLTVTDSAGQSHTSRQSLTVAAAATGDSGSGGSGGGAWTPGWALGLALAVWALGRRSPGAA